MGVARECVPVFAAYCSTRKARLLFGPEAIVAVTPHGGGTTLHYRCSCGELGQVRFDRASHEPASAA